MCEMRFLISTVALLLTIISGLSAQEQVEQNPVTKSDLEGVAAQMRSELRQLNKAAEERDTKAQENAQALAQQQSEELRRANAETEAKLKAELALVEANRLKTEAERKRATRQTILGTMIFVLLSGIIYGAIVVRRPAKAPEVRVVRNHQADDKGILVDPDSPALKQYSKDNGDINPVPFFITLPKEGLKLSCMAELVEGKKPLVVSVEKTTCKIGWDDRHKKIATLFTATQKQMTS